MRERKLATMKIVILEQETVNPGDLDWSQLEALGSLTVYDRCTNEEAMERIGDAEAVFFSKVDMTRKLMEAHPSIKFLCVTATGYDNLDLKAAKNLGIACCHVPDYASDAVAQHVFAMILELTNSIALHNDSVKDGEWNEKRGFCYWLKPLHLLKGKSMGIVGYGNIGKRVSEIAKAFGMNVHVYSREPELTIKSDFISLHIPSTPQTVNFISKERIDKMKDGAYLINTARGSIVDEAAIKEALDSGKLTAYATDVLSYEPPGMNNPLVSMDKVLLTPHNAWCPVEARQIICTVCGENLASWISGGTLNRLV